MDHLKTKRKKEKKGKEKKRKEKKRKEEGIKINKTLPSYYEMSCFSS
jgi:hypothetical protein